MYVGASPEYWFLMVTIIWIPFGVMLLNMLPKVIVLREPSEEIKVSIRADDSLSKTEVHPEQVNIILRTLYFILLDWWVNALWMEAAYAICATIIGLPVGFWMFDRVPAIVSLKR
jgi:uncharacterized membrane protein YccF (DUF307 family)